MRDIPLTTESRERVLDAAEQLFAQKGYTAVTLRDVGAAAGIRHASLYHHVPGGKEALFVEVMERHFYRHRNGLTDALAHAQPNIRQQLYAAADWLLSQPPMDLIRMAYSDLPAVATTDAERLSELAYASMIAPIEQALRQALERGEIDHADTGLIAGGLLGMVESLYAVPDSALQGARTRKNMAHSLVDVILDGIRQPKT